MVFRKECCNSYGCLRVFLSCEKKVREDTGSLFIRGSQETIKMVPVLWENGSEDRQTQRWQTDKAPGQRSAGSQVSWNN